MIVSKPTPRRFSVGTVLLVLSVSATSATATDDVCGFPLSRMYVPDASQVQFPIGFLACLDVQNQTVPRCVDCTCRQLQLVQNGGNAVSWGICLEGKSAAKCGSSSVSSFGRKLCLDEHAWVTVKPREAATTAPTPTPVPTTTPVAAVTTEPTAAPVSVMPNEARSGGIESLTPSTAATSSAPSPTIIAAVVGTIAVVVGVVVLVVFRSKGRKTTYVTPTHADFSSSLSTNSSHSPSESANFRYTKKPRGPHRQRSGLTPLNEIATLRGRPFAGLHDDECESIDSYDIVVDSQQYGEFIVDPSSSDGFSDTTRSMSVDIDTAHGELATGVSQFSVDDSSEGQATGDFQLVRAGSFHSFYTANTVVDRAMLHTNASSITFYDDDATHRSLRSL